MRVLVLGAGAMGSAVGGFLAKAGHAVTLVGRETHMTAVAERGLYITGIWGEHHVTGLVARTDLNGLHEGDFDVIVVAVKSYDTADAALAIAPLTSPDTLVCAYQNGLGNVETIAAVVGWERTVGVRAIYGVRVESPGKIVVTVIAEPTALGMMTDSPLESKARALASAMDEASLPTVYSERVATLIWGKVAYNSALNPLSALLDVPYGTLAETEHTCAIMREVIDELYAVGQASGVALDPATPDTYFDLFINHLVPPTARHYASMHEDLKRGRRTEIDALNGAVCAMGNRLGVSCPTNTMLTRLVHAREYAMGIGGHPVGGTRNA